MLRRVGLLRSKIALKKGFFRTFLSEEFKCADEWQARLSAPFMQKLKLETFFYDIEQSFSSQGKAAVIDIDLFANKITTDDEHHLDELKLLVQKLRLTEEATNVLDSTGHAVIRHYADTGHITDLMTILDNRLEYGVFLDHYITSYLLDHLIKTKNFLAAAKVATQLMLQEDFSNEVSRSLALYACYNYLNNPEPFYEETKVEENETEKKEEIKVRVKFLRNEFFDNHFDIKDHYVLVGKTLIAISKSFDNPLTKSINFLGNFYSGKYENCKHLLKSDGDQLYKDTIEKCLNHLESTLEKNKELETNENFMNLQVLLSNFTTQNKFQNNNFSGSLETFVKEIVSKFEKTEIEKQKLVYLEWNKLREMKLNEEIERLNRSKRIKDIEKITKGMETEEQKLWFFENEDKIDLQIDSKKVRYPKRWFGKKKKPRVIDEGYIPPEIVKGRNH